MSAYNQPIIIQKMTEYEQWEDYFHCRAKVNNLFGAEYYAARTVGEEQTVVFTVRYCGAIASVNSAEHRIIFRSNVYDIKSVDNLHYQNRTVKIKGVKRRGSNL